MQKHSLHGDKIDLLENDKNEVVHPRKSLDRINGMSIVTGFTIKVKDTLGSINGRTPLTALFIAMAPVAI